MSRPKLAFFCSLGVLLLAHVAIAAISFVGADPFTVSARPDSVATGDLNRDGFDDVVSVSRRSDEMNVLLGSATTSSRFASGTVLEFGRKLNAAAVADLNQDNIPDVVVPDEGQGTKGVWVLLGKGDGTFGRPNLFGIGSDPSAVAVADFDGVDGNDLAIADRQLNGVIIGLNDGENPPSFNFLPRIPAGQGPDEIVTADLNGDGHLDLVTLNQKGPIVKEVGVLLFARVSFGFPVFDEVQTYGVGENPFSLVSGDFNNDGNDDIAMLNNVSALPDEVNVLLANSNGTLQAPLSLDVPCPFFTGGRFCRTHAMATGDFDDNGKLDLAIALTDPRVIVSTDALQVFSGRGDGGFVGGPVFPTGKNPAAVGTGDIIGNDRLDLVVATKQRLQVQAFVNVSTPGETGNGEPCFQGDECLSGRCTNGRCCATICLDFERCDVPTHEGVCVRVDPPIECFDDFDCEEAGRCQTEPDRPCISNSDCEGICQLKACISGYCCDENCREGENRCDVPGFEGICIPKGDIGEECFEDDDCTTGFCRDGFCCTQDCQTGACNIPGLEGECQPLLPDGEFCDDDDRACQSGVCDDFDLICCNRVCFDDEFCNEAGKCEAFDFSTPTMGPTDDPNATPTPTPTSNGGQGSECNDEATCDDGFFCVNNVCCVVDQCNEDEHCELGTGTCVEGPPPLTATPTRTPQLPTRTRTPVPGNCPDFCSPEDCQPDGSCLVSDRSGGCSTGGQAADGRDALMLSLLPLALWLGRRWQLQRVAVRIRRRS